MAICRRKFSCGSATPALSGFLLTLIFYQSALSVHGLSSPMRKSTPVECPITSATGFMSIAPPAPVLVALDSGTVPPKNYIWFAGSKKGNVKILQWDADTEDFFVTGEISNATKTIPSPVYSLLSRKEHSSDNNAQLFSGGGDRYITVWENRATRQGVMENQTNWNVAQKLGPHTGWVKALALDRDSNLLHSIGCNCIESWKWTADNGEWKHFMKRSIESSPEQGATLSSDLLSLALWKEFLFAGGVDGRIHVWSSNPEKSTAGQTPLESIAAHQGRVNALTLVALDGTTSLLVSIGLDGTVQCRTCRKTETDFCMDKDLVIETSILEHESGQSARISAMECAKLQDGSIQVLVGTSAGLLVSLCLDLANGAIDGYRHAELKDNFRILLDGALSINAISMAPTRGSRESYCIVGHSTGLSAIYLPSKD
jgi:hypothetical protein